MCVSQSGVKCVCVCGGGGGGLARGLGGLYLPQRYRQPYDCVLIGCGVRIDRVGLSVYVCVWWWRGGGIG